MQYFKLHYSVRNGQEKVFRLDREGAEICSTFATLSDLVPVDFKNWKLPPHFWLLLLRNRRVWMVTSLQDGFINQQQHFRILANKEPAQTTENWSVTVHFLGGREELVCLQVLDLEQSPRVSPPVSPSKSLSPCACCIHLLFVLSHAVISSSPVMQLSFCLFPLWLAPRWSTYSSFFFFLLFLKSQMCFHLLTKRDTV